jgi:hypothetical protein
VEVKAIKNFRHSIEVLGKTIGPFVTGNHYKMEFWIAKVFVKNKILKFVDSNEITIQKIQKIANSQSHASDFKKLDPYLYTAINEYMDIITESENGSTRKFRDLFSNTQDLIAIRQRKILSLSQVNTSLGLSQNLSEEEKVLLEKLTEHVNDWKLYLLDSKRQK